MAVYKCKTCNIDFTNSSSSNSDSCSINTNQKQPDQCPNCLSADIEKKYQGKLPKDFLAVLREMASRPGGFG